MFNQSAFDGKVLWLTIIVNKNTCKKTIVILIYINLLQIFSKMISSEDLEYLGID